MSETIQLLLIKLNDRNPRYIKDAKFEKLCNSIKDFPKMMELRPIVVDDNNVVLGGNMRYQALVKLGYKDVPATWIKKASELSEEEKRRFVVADNLGFGEWDWDILANEFDQEELVDWGFDEKELLGEWGSVEALNSEEPGKDENLEPQIIECPNCMHQFSVIKEKKK